MFRCYMESQCECIERYYQEMQSKCKGFKLNKQDVVREWIARYAEEFRNNWGEYPEKNDLYKSLKNKHL